MKKVWILVFLMSTMLMASCTRPDDQDDDHDNGDDITIPTCDVVVPETVGDMIHVMAVSLPHSTVTGNIDNFINPCKPVDVNPLFFTHSTLRTHQVTMAFDHIHPIQSVRWTHVMEDGIDTVASVSIDVSLNGFSYQRVIQGHALTESLTTIALGGTMAKYVRFVFAADEGKTYGIQDIRFTLDRGYMIKEDVGWTQAFYRTSGWTGADGIFSYNLSSGSRTIGAIGKTGFVFSDTIIGQVNPETHQRSNWSIINNTVGYYDPALPFDDAFSFDYVIENNRAVSMFVPDAYTGKRARHLLDGDGLSISHAKEGLLTNSGDGTMWRSNVLPNALTIDLKTEEAVHHLYLWNDNEVPTYGVKTFSLSISSDGDTWDLVGTYGLDQASGNPGEPYTLALDLDGISTRYLKLDILEGFDEHMVGLGKLMMTGDAGRYLFGSIEANHELTTPTSHERTSRLWLQDGIVIGDTFYNFPLLVKDFEGFFKVFSVGLISMPVIDGTFDRNNITYHSTPLQVTAADGGILYFGAGVMDHRDIDGYLYVYGYKDGPGRHLVVARFLPEDIMHFNRWRYYDGQDWSVNAEHAAPLIDKVSPELSVTYIPEGLHAGKFMLVVMEGTVTGRIAYAIGETPYGPFSDYTLIYQTTEHTYLRDAFTYNAKLHANVSTPGNYLISYNVNTTTFGALGDARIYHPRFIRMIEVKEKE
ncbi:MAG: DUF4185 domain-containing protein [Acholeplasmataceae bacterium]|nr:MAG: DUF4185 domain-containing protein [Acholeplasmataceae bacterium]